MAEDMPTGMFIRRQGVKGFTKEYPTNNSYPSTQWLAFIESKEGVKIQHARNSSEFKVGDKKVPVDGFCRFVLRKFVIVFNLVSSFLYIFIAHIVL